MKKLRTPEDLVQYLRLLGEQGGKARARRHTKEELSAWGKLGGRPKGSGKKGQKKGGKAE